jgi:hypothetical protein
VGGEGHFVAEDGGDVEVDGGGEGEDMVKDIGDLVGDCLALMGVLEEFFYLFVGAESKVLKQFGHFDGHTDGEVFGGLLPVALVAEAVYEGAEVGY